MSVTCAPRARIAENAACPGVSRNVTVPCIQVASFEQIAFRTRVRWISELPPLMQEKLHHSCTSTGEAPDEAGQHTTLLESEHEPFE